MGQESKPMVTPLAIKNELKLVDEKTSLYYNSCSQKFYHKTDLFIQDTADMEYELGVFKFRRINEKLVVSVDYCTNTLERELCSSFSNFSYFIQKLQSTLFEKNIVKVEEGIKFIIQALKGFWALYEQFGYFTPTSKMVCFDQASNVKVWMNQDFRITKNVQYPNCPRSMTLQNNFVREIVRLFDYLRDPLQPLFRFSQNLPHQLLTFQTSINFFQHTLKQMQFRHENQSAIRRQVQNRPFSRRVDGPIQPQFISHHTSPCKIVPHIIFRSKSPERQQVPYLSPRVSIEPNLQQFKEAVSTSLKNTANVSNFNPRFNQSKEMSSTMPASLRNSGIHDRNASIQLRNQFGFNGSEIKRGLLQSEALRRQAAQRYSEAEPTSFGRKVCHNTIMEQDSIVKIDSVSKQMQSSPKKIVFESIIDSMQPKVQFLTHKRHKTDFQIMQVKSQNSSTVNQKSAIEGTLMNKFNINTIKSIHLLEEDRELDTDIIVDLKHLINKYRQRN